MMATMQQALPELTPRTEPRPAELISRAATEQRIVLTGIRWQTYQALLADLGDRPIRLTYDQGRLELLTLSDVHESYKKLLGRFVETVTLELNIPIRSLGSRTFEMPGAAVCNL